jgi:exopolysaccharide biosynthesis polyprenyl glycosylphosphotransferase
MKILDLTILVGSLSAATLFVISHRGTLSFSKFLELRIKVSNLVLFIALLLVWHFVLWLSGLYESKRLSTKTTEAIDIAKATAMASLCLLCFGVVFSKHIVTPLFLAIFWVLSASTIVFVRLVIRWLLSMARRRGKNVRFILVLGTNARAVQFAGQLQARPDLGYSVVGFVDDDWNGSEEFRTTGYKVCCDFSGLSEFLRRNIVDEVATYLPLRSFYQHASQVAALCELHGILMRLDSDIFNSKLTRARAEEFDGRPHIAAYPDDRDQVPMIFKRVLDVMASLLLLCFLAPLFVAVAVVIKLTSRGPVFFAQERIGLNKRRFLTYKFRTMIPNAEKMMSEIEHLNEVSGPVFKIKNDPRLTPVGKFLRRASIDELPQLLNVLKGDMSLVGPRPMAIRDYEGFNEDWQRRRFSVRPGITCLWQVNGRSEVPFHRWMELDMQYIEKWSFWLDLKILLQTIPAVVRGTGSV